MSDQTVDASQDTQDEEKDKEEEGAQTEDAAPQQEAGQQQEEGDEPQSQELQFIVYQDGAAYEESLERLGVWVQYLLLPVYGRETTSKAPWCPEWFQHEEAVAQLYALWMAWQDLTDPRAGLTGPALWHRDHLGPVMLSLRDPSGPFAGCKPGSHRDKEPPQASLYRAAAHDDVG